MLEPGEFEAYWWLPADPDRKFPGTLLFFQDEIRLRLRAVAIGSR
jgi:hypothetical protein